MYSPVLGNETKDATIGKGRKDNISRKDSSLPQDDFPRRHPPWGSCNVAIAVDGSAPHD